MYTDGLAPRPIRACAKWELHYTLLMPPPRGCAPQMWQPEASKAAMDRREYECLCTSERPQATVPACDLRRP
jgi:hypothetical protein